MVPSEESVIERSSQAEPEGNKHAPNSPEKYKHIVCVCVCLH